MHSHELTLGLAFGLGALHALEPGHGKTAMLVYLSGERRSILHPIIMGLSSATSQALAGDPFSLRTSPKQYWLVS